MEKYIRGVAMIPQDYADQNHWYAHWCYIQGHYDFISGERQADETFRTAVERSVVGVLELTSRDLLISNMAQLNLEFHDTLPPEADPRHVIVAFYLVNLYRRSAHSTVSDNPDGRWLSNQELLAGTTSEGLPISPTLTALLHRADLLRSS